MSLITIIVPVYKVEPYLRRCVDSIIAQTFTDFELVLVDDGSPDKCGEICDEYAKIDARTHVIHQANGGLSAARNAGIDWAFVNSNSDSEWITFIDSDDWVHPQYLETLYKIAHDTVLDVIVGGFASSNGDNIWNAEKVTIDAEIWDAEKFYCTHPCNAIVAWGKLYNKRIFAQLRFPLGRLHEDEFIIYRILFENKRVAFINFPLYAYFQNPNGIINSGFSYRRCKDIVAAISEQVEFFAKNNFKAAESMRLPALVNKIYNFYKLSTDNNEQLKLFLRQKLKMVLRKYRCQYPFKENLKLYRISNPIRVVLYKKYTYILDFIFHNHSK